MRDRHLAIEAAVASCEFLEEKVPVMCVPMQDYLDILSSLEYTQLTSLDLKGFSFKGAFCKESTGLIIELSGSFFSGECWLDSSEAIQKKYESITTNDSNGKG